MLKVHVVFLKDKVAKRSLIFFSSPFLPVYILAVTGKKGKYYFLKISFMLTVDLFLLSYKPPVKLPVLSCSARLLTNATILVNVVLNLQKAYAVI